MDDTNKDNQGGGAGIGGPTTNGGAAGASPTPGGTTISPTPLVQKEEMTQVPKSLIEQILAKQEAQDRFIEEQSKTIEQLKYAADKGRMGIWEQRNAQGELIRTARVGLWRIRNVEKGTAKDHYVLGTKMVFQDVVIEDNGGVRRLVEKQTLRIFLDDGADQPMIEIDVPYVYFYQNVQRVEATIVGETKNESGTFKKMRFEDGREIELDVNFLNY